MYYITDYRKRAIDKIIPYLINFPQIVKIIEQSADRYQAIEDILWKIANNFRVDDARGVFLQALAHNEVTTIEYTDKAKDAFTYGTNKPLYQAYGTGHYYSQASYISGIKKNLSDEKTIRTIKAQIIQNNTNGTIEDLIESLKLYYNAEQIKIYESYPLAISLMLVGKNLEISSSGNRKNIKHMLPACVYLDDLYIDNYKYDLFTYDENSSYGDSRYPILIGETTDIYKYVSLSATLNSEHQEYIITNHDKFDDNMYCCIAGSFTQTTPGAVLFSTHDVNNNQSLSVKLDDNDMFTIEYNGTETISNIKANENTQYTIIIANKNNKLKLFVVPNITIQGNNSSQDSSYITNQILNGTPTLEIDYTTINAPIYINAINLGDIINNFADFTYYAIVFGTTTTTTTTTTITEYYCTSFGEKQILFNCLENKNHLNIHTTDPLIQNIMTRQSYYNYKDNHSNGRYLYFNGNSGIEYQISNVIPIITEMNISFDVCMPTIIDTGRIFSDIIKYNDQTCTINFSTDGKLGISIPMELQEIDTTEDGATTTSTNFVVNDFLTTNPVISVGEYANFGIDIKDGILSFYKNGELIDTAPFTGTINNNSTTIKVGYDDSVIPFKGFIRNVLINIIGVDTQNIEQDLLLDLPYTSRLYDINKEFQYTNYGARFITTPQLIDDNTNLDLYNNHLVGKR